MDWIERLNSALEYMEEHLTDEEDICKIARAASTSHFHFQRMFAIISNITVAEYIRRRRLTLAAGEIQKAYPPLTFNISITGVHSMEYEIRDFSRFTIAGVVREFTTVDGSNLREIPRFFEEMDRNWKYIFPAHVKRGTVHSRYGFLL